MNETLYIIFIFAGIAAVLYAVLTGLSHLTERLSKASRGQFPGLVIVTTIIALSYVLIKPQKMDDCFDWFRNTDLGRKISNTEQVEHDPEQKRIIYINREND